MCHKVLFIGNAPFQRTYVKTPNQMATSKWITDRMLPEYEMHFGMQTSLMLGYITTCKCSWPVLSSIGNTTASQTVLWSSEVKVTRYFTTENFSLLSGVIKSFQKQVLTLHLLTKYVFQRFSVLFTSLLFLLFLENWLCNKLLWSSTWDAQNWFTAVASIEAVSYLRCRSGSTILCGIFCTAASVTALQLVLFLENCLCTIMARDAHARRRSGHWRHKAN